MSDTDKKEVQLLTELENDDTVIFECEMCNEEFALTKAEIDEGADTDVCESCQSDLLMENSDADDDDDDEDEDEALDDPDDDEDDINVLDDYDDGPLSNRRIY